MKTTLCDSPLRDELQRQDRLLGFEAYLECQSIQPVASNLKFKCKGMKKISIGIDFAKEKFDVTVINHESGLSVYGQFPNTRGGGRDLLRLVKRHAKGIPADQWLFCGEDTGIYSRTLSDYLTEKGYFMWLQNPYCIKRSEGIIRRGKDDRSDSAAIAEYAARYEDKASKYELPSETVMQIKALLSARDTLVKTRKALANTVSEIPKTERQGEAVTLIKSSTRRLLRDIDAEITKMEEKIDELTEKDEDIKRNCEILLSFKGIGRINAAYFIAFTDNFRKFDLNARKIASYWGVAPFSMQSGTSLDTKPHVSGFCNKKLKAIITNAANSAIIWNEPFRIYYQRLRERGKCEGIAKNNVKNKIIQTITAMIRKGEKYNPDFMFTA